MKIEFLHNNAQNMLESGNQSRIRWFFCYRPSQPKSNADADFVCFIVGVQGNISRLRGGMTPHFYGPGPPKLRLGPSSAEGGKSSEMRCHSAAR